MKALILLSGGLDSTIAAEIMHREGLELCAVNFKTPFCQCDRQAASGGCGSHSRKVAEALGIELKVVNATDDFIEVLKKPKHGYGANVNPCIDCRILFFRKAKEMMKEVGASFIITGEVVGQRPMSQHKRQMEIIERESGLEGLVVKPLSAKLLPPTIAETNGWIDRNHLLAIEGRSRKPQISLAKEFGIKDYPCAAGGCLLTDEGFARRIRDLMKHDELDLANIQLLKAGRYFRLSKEAKLIVGRNEGENGLLESLARDTDHLFTPAVVSGPSVLGRGTFDPGLIELSCKIAARYCDRGRESHVEITYKKPQGAGEASYSASALGEDELAKIRI